MAHLTFTVAALMLTAGLYAQDPPPTTRPDAPTKVPERRVDVTDRSAQGSGNAPLAGSPRARWDSTGVPFTLDTAFASILLDRSQADRIKELDRRNGEELQRLGTKDNKDPRYRDLWVRRSRDVGKILTPVQYERWKQLNAANLAQPAPDEMPVVRPLAPEPPMPVMRDSTKDRMPVAPQSPPKPR